MISVSTVSRLAGPSRASARAAPPSSARRSASRWPTSQWRRGPWPPLVTGLSEKANSTSRISGLVLVSAQGAERRTQLFGKQLRLFPGGEVASSFGFVEVDQVVVGLLGPAARRLHVLVREHRDGRREGEVGGGVEVFAGYGLLPVQPRRGRRGVGEPVERGVVEPVVARDGAEGMSGK